LDALLQGGEVNPIQYPSMGCNIKWKWRLQDSPLLEM
jgi:hypothetical protein